jgi:hypothetical protein
MGKTVESFRIALDGEISRWSGLLELCVSLIEKLLMLMDMSCNNAMSLVVLGEFRFCDD